MLLIAVAHHVAGTLLAGNRTSLKQLVVIGNMPKYV
jgi:hypothetical protein